MELTPLWKYIAHYVDLSDREIAIISDHLKIRTYLKGQFIVQQGDVCKYDNFILAGSTKTFLTDAQGKEHIVMLAVENWWTSDLGSFITQKPADYHVQCLEQTTVVQFSHESFELLFQEVPKFERFFRLILQKAFVESQNRIVGNLSLPAKERYLKFCKQYPRIEQRVPQYLIASYLGITKQFLSKIRAELMIDE
ncbi:MAG: Crp/Fnr family transcriptional regulator [Bacteroidota bacterium]